jgi:hypothetical protein
MPRSRWVKAAGLAAAVAGLTLGAGVLPAQAQAIDEVCAQAGTGYCLNDWGGGGSGSEVAMYDNDFTTNNSFDWISVSTCDGSDILSESCAMASWGADWPDVVGAETIEVHYLNIPGLCVGTNTSTDGTIMAACGSSTGSGAGDGTIMAMLTTGTCGQDAGSYLTDRYFDSSENQIWTLSSSGVAGEQAYFAPTDTSCWSVNVG